MYDLYWIKQKHNKTNTNKNTLTLGSAYNNMKVVWIVVKNWVEENYSNYY